MTEREPDWEPQAEAPDQLVAEEESAAAADAARIGGIVQPLSDDPAMEPLYEAGEGEQEGWEQTERALIENASHGDGHGDPARDAFTPEREADRSTAAYGDSDALESTERDEDVTGAGGAAEDR